MVDKINYVIVDDLAFNDKNVLILIDPPTGNTRDMLTSWCANQNIKYIKVDNMLDIVECPTIEDVILFKTVW